MILKVADSIKDRGSVTFSELSYGKRNPSSFISFQICADSSEWRGEFYDLYHDLLIDLETDDEKVGAFNPPYEGAIRYPSADELMELPIESRMEFFNSFLVFDILRMFLSEDDCEGTASWIVSEITEIGQEDSVLNVRGFVSPLR